MLQKISLFTLLCAPGILCADEIMELKQPTPGAIQNIDRAPQVIKVRESTITHQNYIFTHYKLIKQSGPQFHQIPNTAEISFETPTRLGRGKATIMFDPSYAGYATAHIHDLEVSQDHQDVIRALHSYLKIHFTMSTLIWHVSEKNKLVYDACKELNYEIATKSIIEENLSNKTI
ncbi:hypothetical protein JST56_07405 [Candidatus Dependentiae bacterium]|nr:hypothetical protein [Candidatus Dependentiae bacterium]